MKNSSFFINCNIVLYLIIGVILFGLTDIKKAREQNIEYLYHVFSLDPANCRNGIKYYDSIARLNPKDPRPWRDMGVCQFQLGKYERAVASYQRAIRLDPTNTQYSQEFADLQAALKEFNASGSGE